MLPPMHPRSLLPAAILLTACASEPQTPAENAPADKAGPAAESATTPAKRSLPDRNPEIAHRLVEQEGALLLDVRTPQEFALGHIEGARNIPHEQVKTRIDEIRKLAGDGAIVVYCRSGRRSGIAKEALVDAGITQVTNLGGMDDW